MWEMNVSKAETGIAGYSYSCRKSLDIKPFNRFYFPLAFWKNDELLMKDAHNGMLSYNVRSRKLRKPPGYVKSLVFIKGKRQTFFLL